MDSEVINRLLVVDDEAAQVEALCRTLEDEGYSVKGFTGTGAALAALRAGSFDIVLTDLTMPGMDGIAFLNAAREIDPGLAGIVMTGHGTIATAVDAMKAGALDYILKPFDLRVILRVLARTQAMLRLRRENAALLERLSLRTVELETANRELQVANRELEAFSDSVSHDLRAPLRSLEGFSQVLLEDFAADLDEEAQRYLGRIQANVARMAQMIDDLLHLSRATRSQLRREHTDLSELAREVCAELAAQQPDRRVQIDVPDGLVAQADPHLVRLVLQNLLGNAWKFTAHRDDAVIRVRRDRQDGVDVFCVEDNGAGFDPAYAYKMFDPFQRLHSASEFEGTGIGLAIVARVVTRHGGQIRADGTPGSGATFRFSLTPAPAGWELR
jgi:signal transduction histidine kinase